jgi:hypothetical protein
VAVKILPAGPRQDADPLARFRREASAHGTVFDTPRSISATQRLTLVVHAASASSSPSAWQGLSGKVLAKRARDDYVLSHLVPHPATQVDDSHDLGIHRRAELRMRKLKSPAFR